MPFRIYFSSETYSLPQLLLVEDDWEKAHLALITGNAAMNIDLILEN